MNFKEYLQSWNGKVQEISYHRKIIIILLMVLVLYSLLLFKKETIVIIQPFTLSNEASVMKDDSTQSYKEAWGLALAILLGNATPGNVEYIKESISPMLHSSIYIDAMIALQMQIDQIKEDRISTRFEPRAVYFETTTKKVFVSGYSFIQSGIGKPDKKERTYEFIIDVSNYMPVIKLIDTYQGQARTEDILKKVNETKKRLKAKEANK